jgi:hypothetical protein
LFLPLRGKKSILFNKSVKLGYLPNTFNKNFSKQNFSWHFVSYS